MLIIVESPTKAKKIQSLLKTKAMSTVGHFKDLPDASLGVDLATYEPTFVYHEKKAHLPQELRAAARGETVMLAGDPDREGYAISCHIFEEVKSVAKECLRMEIYEVTEKGLKEALAKAVPFDQTNTGLYNAFLGRRIGDRLVGYILSPITSKALRRGYSVGRVQSPALRILAEREREIKSFVPETYFVLSALFNAKEGNLAATCTEQPKTQEEADRIERTGKSAAWSVADIAEKAEERNPRPPFTTSTLQQVASTRLGFAPSRTMRAAQKLYERFGFSVRGVRRGYYTDTGEDALIMSADLEQILSEA